jgi:uncharacterized YccA/Bax inhibitor family protein
VNAAAKTIIHYVGTFMILSYVGGMALLLARIPVSEAILTTMIVAPVTTALGGLLGMLAKTGTDKPSTPSEEAPNP